MEAFKNYPSFQDSCEKPPNYWPVISTIITSRFVTTYMLLTTISLIPTPYQFGFSHTPLLCSLIKIDKNKTKKINKMKLTKRETGNDQDGAIYMQAV